MKSSLSKKIVIFIEIITLIIVVVGGTVSYLTLHSSLSLQLYSQLQSISLLKKQSVNFYLKTGINEIEHLANENKEISSFLAGNTKVDVNHIRSEVKNISIENKALSDILLIDKDGMVVLSNAPDQEGKIKSGEQFFQKVKEKTVIQEYYFDIQTGKPSMFIAAPVKDEKNKFKGAVIGKISIDEISDIVTSRSGLGETGESFLVNSFNMAVTDLKKEPDSAFIKTIYTPNIKACLNGGSVSDISNDYHGDKVVGYWSWFPELKSCFVTKIDASEAFAPVVKSSIFFIIVMLILGLIVGYISYVSINFFIRPFKNLRDEIIKIKNGDFNVSLNINSKDEIGDISLVFNDMAKNLSAYKVNLEAEVTDRTNKLNSKVGDLENTKKAVVNLLEDIEKEKKISEIQASELKKFELVIENTSQHVIITDTEGTIIYANPAVTAITGYSNEEVIGQNPSLWGKQMPPDFYLKMWSTIKNEKKTFTGEIKNRRKNGEIYISKAIISPVLDNEGEIKFFVGLETDISKEKLLEQALVKEKESVELKVVERTKELNEERARLLSSINSIPFGLIIADNNNNIIMKNNAIMNILNFNDNKIISFDDIVDSLGKNFNLKTKIEQCSKHKKVCELNEISFNDKIFRGIISPIIMSESADGIGYLLLIEDITEEKIIERSKDEFFAVASHELRTPLTAIRGNSSMLLDFYSDKVKDSEASEMLQDINDASKRLIGIVNDFLDASRLEQGRIEIKKDNFELTDLVKKTISEVEEMAKSKNLSINFDSNKNDIINLSTDKGKVEQVLVNLLGNAIKFTKEGEIVVKLVVQSGFVKISVKDTGPGISAKNENLLFRKFQPAGEHILTRDVTKSTGLGLYISRLLVSKLGGTIGLENSVVGEGSTFFFTLPIGDIV